MYDLLFVGGGLASGLAAFRLAQLRPELATLVVEGGPALGGTHTWSFFPTDLTDSQLAWIEPLILHRWPCYEVRFPGLRRRLDTGYCSTDSRHFHTVLTQSLAQRVRLDARVRRVDAAAVELQDGETIRARCVIDGRGPVSSAHLTLGFQKFTGLVLELVAGHGLDGPVIMDATVAQEGDYRFLYALPHDDREVLVEDTRYSNRPELDAEADRDAILRYAAGQGWRVRQVIREERGVLPITLGGDVDAFWREADGIPRIGLRGAFFHATTGYSFAEAVRTADTIAEAAPGCTAEAFELLRERSTAHWRRQWFWRLLNRMLFMAAEPDRRWLVMRRFYGLRQPLIERFYAGRSTGLDMARILSGRPPVPIGRALRCLPERSAAAFAGGATA
jgi:lycopene beta-cyclase